MITFQLEKFIKTFDEFSDLYFMHYQELPIDTESSLFEMQVKEYAEKEAKDGLIFATVRDNHIPIGYFLGFLSDALHYKNCKTCTGDIFFIHKKYQGRLLGKRLFKFVEKQLKEKNIKRLFVGTNLNNRASELLQLIGYKPFEVLHYKNLI